MFMSGYGWVCWACGELLHANETIWLGETYNTVELVWPFHRSCADKPWPLYEVASPTIAQMLAGYLDAKVLHEAYVEFKAEGRLNTVP